MKGFVKASLLHKVWLKLLAISHLDERCLGLWQKVSICLGKRMPKRVGQQRIEDMEEKEIKAKRIRGHQLEIEQNKTKTLAKGPDRSALVNKLLSLWSHGILSAKMCQELAHLAVLDGAKSQELSIMAGAGNWGQVPGNTHRDFLANFCRNNGLTKAFEVEVPVRDPKTSKLGTETAALFLPHMLFSDLALNYKEQFHKMFATEQLEQFWANVRAVKDQRLTGHPITLDKRSGAYKKGVVDSDKTIPLFCHCDGVEFQTRDSLLVWNWGGLLSSFSSLASHLLITSFPKSCATDMTWRPLMKYIKWSLESLQDGFHPAVGPDQEPLPKGSIFEQLAGQPLTSDNYRGVVWSIQGDHEAYSNIWGLPHWQNRFPCWECDCQQPLTKGEPCPPGKSFKVLKEEDQKFETVGYTEALTKGISAHALFGVEGLNIKMVRHDGLHVMFARGVCSHLCGSILHALCFLEGKGKQHVKPTERLSLLFNEIQEDYKKNKATSRLTNLKLSMFCEPKSPHKDFPVLQCKASECKRLMFALVGVVKRLLDKSNEMHKQMAQALASLASLVQLFDEAGMFLDKRTCAKANALAHTFFHSYSWLHEWAAKKDLYLFHITIKFHMLSHLIKSAADMNPKYTWNFRAEDYVGKVSTLGASVVHGVKTTKLSMKICAKYQVLLHLEMERLGFDTMDFAPDP